MKLKVGKLYREGTGRVFTITAIKEELSFRLEMSTKYYFYYLDDPNRLLCVWDYYTGYGNIQEIG